MLQRDEWICSYGLSTSANQSTVFHQLIDISPFDSTSSADNRLMFKFYKSIS